MRLEFQEIKKSESKYIHLSKEYRLNNPKKRQAYVKKNYAQTRKNATNAGKPWTQYEEDLIMNSKLPDREIAALIKRGVAAIQVHRSLIRNGKI